MFKLIESRFITNLLYILIALLVPVSIALYVSFGQEFRIIAANRPRLLLIITGCLILYVFSLKIEIILAYIALVLTFFPDKKQSFKFINLCSAERADQYREENINGENQLRMINPEKCLVFEIRNNGKESIEIDYISLKSREHMVNLALKNARPRRIIFKSGNSIALFVPIDTLNTKIANYKIFELIDTKGIAHSKILTKKQKLKLAVSKQKSTLNENIIECALEKIDKHIHDKIL